MTTPLPTDEELERWAHEVTVKPATPRESALQVAVEGLLAYVRHLRGEVETSVASGQPEWTFGQWLKQESDLRFAWSVASARAVRAEALVFDLRKQLESAARLLGQHMVAVQGVTLPLDPADEEARLSDPKRHPYNPRLAPFGGACADCGGTRVEHKS